MAWRNEDSPKKIIRSTQDSLTLRTNLSAKAFRFGLRAGRRNGWIPALLRISLNCSVKCVERSWIKKRNPRKKAVARVGHIPPHLYHLWLAGLRYHSGKMDFARHQAHDEEHVLLKNSNLLFKIFDDELLAVIHPAGNAGEQKGQGIHAVSLHSTRFEGEYFLGNRPPQLNAKPRNTKTLPPFEFLDSTGW